MDACGCSRPTANRLRGNARRRTYDPTHTLTLRRQFSAEMYKRFRDLKGVIRQAIVEQDVLGLSGGQRPAAQARSTGRAGTLTPPGHQAFAFNPTESKIQGFMDWLDEQEQEGVLETIRDPQVGTGRKNPWTNTYIQSAYKKGLSRGRDELVNANYPVPDLEESGGLDTVFHQPIHADKVGSIYARAFNELKGVTDAMDQQISRELASGVAEGINPKQMAKRINDRVDKIGLTRARTLARTETIRAHHVATVQEYRNWSVEGVKVKAEWETAGDERVCPICLALEDRTYTPNEIEPMIPRHPNCRCLALPVDYTDVPASEQPAREGEAPGIDEDPVASQMSYREHAERYMRYKQEYRRALAEDVGHGNLMTREKEAHDDIVQFMRNDPDLNHSMTMFDSWQNSAEDQLAIQFKLRAAEIEDAPVPRIPDDLESLGEYGIPRSVEEIDARAIGEVRSLPEFTEDQYLKLRAFNQAYMDAIDQADEVTLYRGTGGKFGQQVAKDLSSGKHEGIELTDNTLASYADESWVADEFGVNGNGITIRYRFPQDRIVVHPRLLGGATKTFIKQREFIPLGLRRARIGIDDIKFKYPDGTVKQFVDNEGEDLLKYRPGELGRVEKMEEWASRKYPHIRFSFRDTDGSPLDRESVREVLEQFDQLSEEYPDIQRNMSFFGASELEDLSYGRSTWGSIEMNTKWMRDSAQWRDSLRQDMISGWRPAMGIDSTVTHEYGHQIRYWIDNAGEGKALVGGVGDSGLGTVKGTLRRFLDQNKPTAKISRTALVDETEGFAEGFVRMHHGIKAKMPTYVKRQRKLLDRIGRYEDEWLDDWSYVSDLPGDQQEEALERLNDLSKAITGK
jgi:SPP1 gp7 family putative phage head morphogenesis protein